MKEIKIYKTRNVKTPARAHAWDAGADCFCPDDLTEDEMKATFKVTSCPLNLTVENGFVKRIEIRPGESVLIPTGIKMLIPEGYVVNFENKSGVASKKHLIFGSKVCDAGYEGVVHVNLHNVGNTTVFIDAGEKIAQFLTYAVETPAVTEVSSVEELYGGASSARGEGGFGSTDR